MAKIITQCHTTDLKYIIELSTSHEIIPKQGLNKKQKLAMVAVFALLKIGLTLSEIYSIKTLLFWDDRRWEFRFRNTTEAIQAKKKVERPEATGLLDSALFTITQKPKEG